MRYKTSHFGMPVNITAVFPLLQLSVHIPFYGTSKIDSNSGKSSTYLYLYQLEDFVTKFESCWARGGKIYLNP